MRIALAGNINGDFLAPGLQIGLADLAIKARIIALPYDSWIPEALDGGIEAGVWVIWISAMGASRGQTERSALDVGGIAAAVRALVVRGCQVVVILPEALSVEDDPFSPFVSWRASLVDQLREALSGSAILLSLDSLQRSVGPGWFATRYWTLAKCPCHPDAATAVAEFVADVLVNLNRQDIRAIVCDLDDTLWGGIVGEVGPEGLRLDPDGDGSPFLALQRYLKDISDTGIPLSVVSKNDPDQARRPFIERDEMVLQYDDFVYFSASWNSKYEAIAEIIKDLNLGPDQVCFLDDSPFERDQARRFLPGLIVPELDKDPEQRLKRIIDTGMFIRPILRAEDKARVDMYRADKARRILSEKVNDPIQYLRGLEMRLKPTRIAGDSLPRIAQLVQKTNQFNLTNKRIESNDILAIAQNNENFAYGYSISDRFGDSGLIGVVLGTRTADVLDIEVWLLSCRVFNRTVEYAVFAHVLDWCVRSGVRALRANYNPSPKNKLLRNFLPNLGFTPIEPRTDECQSFTYQCDSPILRDHHLLILDEKKC
jgi:FkbH-like protein